jgi:hypothetical protein
MIRSHYHPLINQFLKTALANSQTVIGNILVGGQQEATCAAGRVYVPTDTNTKKSPLRHKCTEKGLK